MCQYETALMIIALYDKIYRIWRGRQGNSRGIIKKKNLYLIIMVLSSIWPQVSTRNFLLVFWAFVFRTLETINFLLYEPSYTIGVGNRELLRHHKFQHLLKIFLKLPALSLKHFPNLLNNFNNTAHHTHKRPHAPIARFKREKLQTICCRWRCG